MNRALEHTIMQELTWGETPQAVALRHNLTIEEVVEVIKHMPGILPAHKEARRALALARLDMLASITLEAAKSSDMGAIKTYLEIQKREAALTGMDEPTRQDTTVTVDVPWLRAERLAYKKEKGLATDIMAKSLPYVPSASTPDGDE